MASVKKAQVIITADGSVAEKVMDELKRRASDALDKMNSLTDCTKVLKDEMADLEKQGKKNSQAGEGTQ